ncbi:MAG: hypothetical protein LBP19_08025 [Treponema sp.]|nr:hypothetical protein [Treponema sp.]
MIYDNNPINPPSPNISCNIIVYISYSLLSLLHYVDDLIILPILIYVAIKLIPKKILEECKEEAKDLWKNGKPKKWYYGIPIMVIWILIGVILLKNILGKIL